MRLDLLCADWRSCIWLVSKIDSAYSPRSRADGRFWDAAETCRGTRAETRMAAICSSERIVAVMQQRLGGQTQTHWLEQVWIYFLFFCGMLRVNSAVRVRELQAWSVADNQSEYVAVVVVCISWCWSVTGLEFLRYHRWPEITADITNLNLSEAQMDRFPIREQELGSRSKSCGTRFLFMPCPDGISSLLLWLLVLNGFNLHLMGIGGWRVGWSRREP